MDGPIPVVRQSACLLCCACRNACPRDAIRITAGAVEVDQDRCNGCAACVEACIPEAIAMTPRRTGDVS